MVSFSIIHAQELGEFKPKESSFKTKKNLTKVSKDYTSQVLKSTLKSIKKPLIQKQLEALGDL